MPETPLFGLPLLTENQAGRVDLAHNEAIVGLELTSNLAIASRTLFSPPTTIQNAFYVPKSPATGAWAGKENKLAYYFDSSTWRFYDPPLGFRAYCIAEALDLRWNGTTWDEIVIAADMNKSVYDTDNDGIVDAAETAVVAAGLNGIASAFYLDRANHTGTQTVSSLDIAGDSKYVGTDSAGNKGVFDIPQQSSPETGASIKGKLEALTGTNRLEASAIQNLPSGTTETGQSIATKLESLTGTDRLNASAIEGLSFGSSQTNLVEEIVVTTPVSSISFNPDNLIFGEDYQLVISGKLTANDRIDIQVNGDVNSNGYDIQFLTANGTVVSAGREINSNSIASPTATNSNNLSITNFSTIDGWFRWASQEVRDNVPAILMTHLYGRRNSQIPNFTSLVLKTRTGGVNFQAGTTFRLYRLNNSTNLVNRPVQTSDFTALRNSIYPLDTSAAPVTATLDITANWRVGDRVTFVDRSGTRGNNSTGFGLNNLTIAASGGQNIAGNPNLVLDRSCQSITLQYAGSSRFDVLAAT
ncbi:MAG: DUF2793 domain-containing protein [Waterburya sp.]